MTAATAWRRIVTTAGPFLGLLFVLGLFALDSEVRGYFFTGANAKIVLVQTVIVALGALGMTMIIVSGGIDLSAGAVVALTSVVGARLLTAGWPPAAAAAAAILTGAVFGLVSGGIIAWFRMMPFVVTLGTMGVARGTAKWLAGNQTVSNPPGSALHRLMELQQPRALFPLPPGVWITVLLAALMTVVMRRTVFGRHVFALGGSEAATRLCGVRIPGLKICVYALGGLFFGLAGVMQLARLTQGDPTVAIGLELDIIAAVVIGGASLNGGTGSIAGAMLGALIMAVLRNGSNQMGWPNYVQEIIIGTVIVLAVGLDKWRQRDSAKGAKSTGPAAQTAS